MESARFRLFLILHKPAPTHALTRYVNYLLAGVILMNCAAVALETVPAIHEPNRSLFRALEFFSTVFLSSNICYDSGSVSSDLSSARLSRVG